MSLRINDTAPDSTAETTRGGDAVIIAPAVSDEEARKRVPVGWEQPVPCIRLVEQASVN